MASMSYCRFTNTLSDLRDCYDAMDEIGLSDEEKKSRRKLIKLCAKIASEWDEETDEGPK